MRDTSPGKGGNHGPQHEFAITLHNTEHPITKGMPPVWMHSKDELYDSLRGPAENLEVLAERRRRHHRQGRADDACAQLMARAASPHAHGPRRLLHGSKGFQETLERGTEWAATGTVERTAALPADFPTATQVSPPATNP